MRQIRVITKLPNSEMTDAALSLFHIASRWDPPCTPFSSTNKTDRQYITEILLKVGLNTIKRHNLMLHWLTFSCMRGSPLILTISHDEIKGKMFNLPKIIDIFMFIFIIVFPILVFFFNRWNVWNSIYAH
jgi:hypothetical protein